MLYPPSSELPDRWEIAGILSLLFGKLKVTVGIEGVSSTCLALLCLNAFKICRIALSHLEHITKVLEKLRKCKQSCAKWDCPLLLLIGASQLPKQ